MGLLNSNMQQSMHMKIIGVIILNTIEIERKIDLYLSRYFCSDSLKQQEFSNRFLFHERITLDFKKEIFLSILKSKNRLFLTENPLFASLLDKLPQHRNRFAHLEAISAIELAAIIQNQTRVQDGMDLENTLKSIDRESIIYKRFKNGTPSYIGYTYEKVRKLELSMYGLMDLLDELNYVEPPTDQ